MTNDPWNGQVQALKQQCQVQASQFKAALERLQAGFGRAATPKAFGLFQMGLSENRVYSQL